MVFNVQSGHDFVTETTTFKVQRGITTKYTSKNYGSCDRLISVNISMMFHEDTLKGFQERTALYSVRGIAKVQRGHNYKNIHRLLLVNSKHTSVCFTV